MSKHATDSKERIVNATISLLRRGGMAAAGLNQVVELAKAPKGSLYYYFPSGKSEMVSVALESYRLLIARELERSLGARGGVQRRIKNLFDSVDHRMSTSLYKENCAVANVMLSLGEGDQALGDQCQDILSYWSDAVAPQLHELPKPLRSRAAWFLINVLEGAQLLSRARANGSPLKDASKAYGSYILSLQSSEKKC